MKPSSELASSPTCPQDLMSSPCHLIQQMRKLEGLCAPQTPHGVGKVGTGESVLEPKAASEYPAQVLGPWASPLPTSPTRVALLPDQASSWSSQSPRLGEISPLYPAEVCGEVLKSSEFADNSWEHPRAEAPPPLLRRTSCGSGPEPEAHTSAEISPTGSTCVQRTRWRWGQRAAGPHPRQHPPLAAQGALLRVSFDLWV